MTKARIYNSTDKCMDGVELKRLRKEAGLSQEQLAGLMHEWGWYREKVVMFEHSNQFCLCKVEIEALLSVLKC